MSAGTGTASVDAVRIVDVLVAPDPVAALRRVTGWYVAAWGDRYPADQLAPTLDELARPGPPVVLVALDGDDAVVGTVAIDPDDVPDRGDLAPWLASLYVDAAWRRRGLGARLVDAVCARAAADGLTHLHLMTYDEDGLDGWYRRLGWAVVDRGVHAGRSMLLFTRSVQATKPPDHA